VVGIGAEPNVEWLAGSGVDVDGGVLCDAMGRTNVPGIVAVGDCAAWFDAAVDKHRRVEHWTGALERAALAVQALLDSHAPAQPLKPPYFWSDQHGVKIQFAGHSAGYDRLDVDAGDAAEHSLLAVYYREDVPVAVLGMNQPRLFTKWRRSLAASAPKPAAAVVPEVSTPADVPALAGAAVGL
jgi:NADPH-dependent 2,4-dienoyl-CoA reductase/sulfur reductase-like enzyme